MIAKYLIQLRQSKLCRKGCCQPPYDVTPLETAMPLGVKGRRSYPLLRLGSYKPMAFWPWVVDHHGSDDDRRHLAAVQRRGPGPVHRLLLHRLGRLPPAGGTAVRLQLRQGPRRQGQGVISEIRSVQSSFEMMVSKLLFFVGEKAP